MNILPKIKIYVQLLNDGCHLHSTPKGDLIDLRAAKTVDLNCPQVDERYKKNGEYYRDTHVFNEVIPLGVRILMPKGFKANVYPRSGTYNNYNIILGNSVGQIDWCYNGPNDEWKVNYIALGPCHIEGPRPATENDYIKHNVTVIKGVVQGDRIAQFEIVLSQKATFWQKLKWLFSSGIEIVYVNDINTISNRGGFNSTGVK